MARSIPLSQAADEMTVSADTVRRLLDRGELAGHRVGRDLRVFVDSVDDYQHRHLIRPRIAAPPKPPKRPNKGHLRALLDLERLGV